MMLSILAESALRSLLLGSAVWAGLRLFHVRNPHVHMTCWVLVLVASLSMPLLMQWTTVTITRDVLPVAPPEGLWPVGSPSPDLMPSMLAPEQAAPAPVHLETSRPVDWLAIATAIYAAGAGLLLLRLVLGIGLTWNLVRAARPMREPWTSGWRVRVSNAINGPVTFGSTILLPPQCTDWDWRKRSAVLAHEGAHVANRDFYVLLLASLNRALFWFSPFAWWQQTRLAELAEIISDSQALEVVEDRLSYAEILLDLVQRVRRAPAGLEMARASTVRARIERLLAITTMPPRLNWRKRLWIAAVMLPVIVLSAGSITTTTRPVSARSIEGEPGAVNGGRVPHSIAFYSFDRAGIFTVSHEGADLFGQLGGQRKLRLTAAGHGTYTYPAVAGQITLAVSGDEGQPPEAVLSQNGQDVHAVRLAEVSSQGAGAAPPTLDAYVGFYELTPARVLAVTRDGDRLSIQETGRARLAATAYGTDAFVSPHDDVLVFLREGNAAATQVLVLDPVTGGHQALRVTDVRAGIIEAEFSRRIAQVPDRFREQAPLPGSKEAILRGIEDLRRGEPNDQSMSASLAARIRRQLPELQSMFNALGAVESIYFRGVGPGGYDVYGVKFANGFAEIRLELGADGKANDVIFHADGDGSPGVIATCADEQGLKPAAGTAPIHLLIYNATDAGIQLHKLDADGKRIAGNVIGADMSSLILTSVGTPWVVTDASGKCLEVVLPGQYTRYHTVEGLGADGQPEHSLTHRAAPQAGSETMLREYIEAVGRGEPNYDRMTAQVAAQTRAQLPLNRAILGRLGALRAISFRGVTTMGTDIYTAHFANGTAEWRIALLKDGSIGRITMGPQ